VRNEEECVCSPLQITLQYPHLISGKIIKEMPGLVASGTPCIKAAITVIIWMLWLVSC